MSTLLNKKKKNIVLIILSFIIVGIILFVYFNRPQADTKSIRTETVPSDKGKLIGNISGEIDLNKQVYIDLNGQESSHIYVQNDGYFQADDLTPGQYIYTVYDDDNDFALPDVTEPYVYIEAGMTEYLDLKNVKKYDNEYRNPIKPTITSFSPQNGKVGDKITVKGSQMYIDALFFINEVRVADSTFITPEESTIIVPQGATTGKISVSDNDYTVQSSNNFTVTTPPPTTTTTTTTRVVTTTTTTTTTPNTPPVVKLISPSKAGTIKYKKRLYTLIAEATDADGIKNSTVEFWDGNKKKLCDAKHNSSDKPNQYSCKINNVAKGSYWLNAVAYDTKSLKGSSDTYLIQVK